MQSFLKSINIVKKLANNTSRLITYVPKHKPPDPNDIEKLEQFLRSHDKIFVLTGAGISTESGIPDYRSEDVGLYARSNHKPVLYQDFVRYQNTRKRYWARNYIGWPRFSQIKPNDTHYAISQLEKLGKSTIVVTQNVDRLHHKAGTNNVIELHGSGYTVSCLLCKYTIDRDTLQQHIANDNPDMRSDVSMIRPDGDVELSQEQIDNFNPPLCPKCGSSLKPDIVFFGDNIPRSRINSVRRALANSDSLLILGSSLTVYSSHRIVVQGYEDEKPMALINIGPTRADELIPLRVSAKCGDILPKLIDNIKL